MEKDELDSLEFLAYSLARNGHWERATPLYEAVVALDGSSMRRRQALAYALLQSGRAQEALALLDSCVAQSDEAPSRTLVLLRARALWALGLKEDAQKFLAHPERSMGGAW